MANVLRGPQNVSAAEFARALAESGLLDPAAVNPDAAPDGLAAARQLVEAGKLTGYQADALLNRRPGDLRIGNYEVLDRLGAGGMGAVFKARHRRMKRVVALKLLPKSVAGELADRFQREVETIARLSHPNVVMAHDADETEAGPFLVMEFVDGRDLQSEVADRGPLPAADAVDRIVQAARGLEYAHHRGIVHRDVKPGNILRDRDGVVKVADLGLARLAAPGATGETSLTQVGSVFGTAEYMSPEQADDPAHVDGRADIYSLGCTLFFLLTGRPPYQAPSFVSLVLRHRDEPIPTLVAERPDVPPELEAVFRKMVAKAPADRYRSMADVVRELEQLQSKLGPAGAVGGAAGGVPDDEVPQTAVLDRAAPAGSRETSGIGFSPTAATGLGPAAGLVVVLAEPSRTQAGIIRRYLAQLGTTAVHAAGCGREALEVARRERAAVVISAMHLADMTGAELAAAVLADTGCEGTGFVLATSETDPAGPCAVPESPRVVVVPKPFDRDRLGRAVAAVVG
jgi:CheY-like chemotaxis protein/tRNA A-37 threonylcarbamoyl transferase component Bud32